MTEIQVSDSNTLKHECFEIFRDFDSVKYRVYFHFTEFNLISFHSVRHLLDKKTIFYFYLNQNFGF